MSVAISGIILALQFPITIYSPDVSFHAAKILRASNGEFFADPITGAATIYPPLFHFCFGLLKRAFDLNSIQIVRLIVVLDFTGLFAAFYYLAGPFLSSAEKTSACVLCLPLVFYAPTSRYLLLAQPSSFSFVVLIFGLGALYRYLMDPKLGYLLLGGFLASLAVNIWWSNLFAAGPVLLLLSWYAMRRGLTPKGLGRFLFILVLGLPGLFTAWHFYSIRSVLPGYLAAGPRQRHLLDMLADWIVTFLTKGNLQFVNHFRFWDLSQGPAIGASLPNSVKLAYSLVAAFHYFALVLPFNLILVFFVGWRLLQKRERGAPSDALLRTLAIGGVLVVVSSFAIFTYQGVGHLRRVHFITYVMFLLFAFASARYRYGTARRLLGGVCAASVFSLAFTVVYSPRWLTSRLPEADDAIVRFIASIPDHDNERIFMMDDGLRRVAPFVAFRSFVEREEGRYYSQDYITAAEMYGRFDAIKGKRPGWRRVLREGMVRWMIFRTSVAREAAVFTEYRGDGLVVFRTRDWVVLKVNT